MSKVFSNMRKKRCSAVTVNGDEYFIGSMDKGELRRLDALPSDLRTAFVMGCILRADATGAREVPQEESESDEDWARRVDKLTDDVPTETLRELAEAAANLGKVPKQADVVKN